MRGLGALMPSLDGLLWDAGESGGDKSRVGEATDGSRGGPFPVPVCVSTGESSGRHVVAASDDDNILSEGVVGEDPTPTLVATADPATETSTLRL